MLKFIIDVHVGFCEIRGPQNGSGGGFTCNLELRRKGAVAVTSEGRKTVPTGTEKQMFGAQTWAGPASQWDTERTLSSGRVRLLPGGDT